MRALLKSAVYVPKFFLIIFFAVSLTNPAWSQEMPLTHSSSVPGVTMSDLSPCADSDSLCWKRWQEIAKHSCLIIGSSPLKASGRCLEDVLALARVAEASQRLAASSVLYASSGCPNPAAKEYCRQAEEAARQDSDIALRGLRVSLPAAQDAVLMLKCRTVGPDQASLANCYCAGKPASCKADLAKELDPDCYRPTASPDVWKCLCRKHIPTAQQSDANVGACISAWLAAEKTSKTYESFWDLKCPSGRYAAFCGEGEKLEARCLPDGVTCCGEIMCSAGKKCLPVSPDPMRYAGMVCADLDIEYCAGIGICPKGTKCWTFGGKPACLPPETDVCKTLDCGIIGPHKCTACCPRYHSHPVVWEDPQIAGWCIARCECAPGPASDDVIVTEGMRGKEKMTIEFTGGSSSDFHLKTAILVAHEGRTASGYVDAGNGPGGCAVAVANLARQIGLPVELEGMNRVMFRGTGIKVTVANGCANRCLDSNCPK